MSVVAHFCCLSFGILYVLVFVPFLHLEFSPLSVCAFTRVFSYRLVMDLECLSSHVCALPLVLYVFCPWGPQ